MASALRAADHFIQLQAGFFFGFGIGQAFALGWLVCRTLRVRGVSTYTKVSADEEETPTKFVTRLQSGDSPYFCILNSGLEGCRRHILNSTPSHFSLLTNRSARRAASSLLHLPFGTKMHGVILLLGQTDVQG
ncbi:MAG: hypothetical protein AAFQ98_00785 [Bacteroidota bacterium]